MPGWGGSIGLAIGVAIAAAALTTGYTAGRRQGFSGAVIAVAVCILVGLALRQLPSQLNDRRLQYRNQSAFGAQSSEAEVQHAVGVDAGFLAFAAERLPPHATFYVTVGAAITTSAPQSWAQWALMPRIEEYRTPCRANWILFVEASPHLAGVRTAPPTHFGAGRNWIARVEAPCTP